MPILSIDWLKRLGASWLAVMVSALPATAQGIVMSSVGPVNRSMGGASVAAPLDASGALYWNPATVSGLGSSEMDIGVELLYPRSTLSSSAEAGSFGPGIPPVTLSGSTKSDTGVFVLPTFGLVYQPDDSSWTFGLGLFPIGGFGSNYSASKTNPILTPQPPNGLGLGAVYSQLLVVQLVPTAAYRLTEHISIGVAPTMDLASLTLDSALFVPPDDANGDGFPTYPSGTHSRIHWGAGFEAGAYYSTGRGWSFGASVKSPQWFETFRYNSADELGRPRSLKLRFDYPMIMSIGVAYSGFDRFLFATDIRYIDYKNTKGFGPAGFDANGAVTGLGWDSIVVAAAGVQYRWSDRISLRLGYTFGENPIPDAVASFNVASASIDEHVIYLGASYKLMDCFTLAVSYQHSFSNSITGPIVGLAGPISGTSVRSELTADSLAIGASVRF